MPTLGDAGDMWRSPSRAAEDRNNRPDGTQETSDVVAVALRAAEDRNGGFGPYDHTLCEVAVLLRGGRGSQLRGLPAGCRAAVAWRSPCGAAEDRNTEYEQGAD